MNLYQKIIIFSVFIFMQTMIQSSLFFEKSHGQPRIDEKFDNTYYQSDFKTVIPTTLPKDELFIVVDPINHRSKIGFWEQKPNGKYQVNFFTIEKPNISAEFTTAEEAQEFLSIFMSGDAAVVQKPFYFPLPPRGSGQDWRRVPTKHSRR